MFIPFIDPLEMYLSSKQKSIEICQYLTTHIYTCSSTVLVCGLFSGMQVGFFLCGGSTKSQNTSAAQSAKADYERCYLEHGASSWTLENKRHLGNDVQLAETLNTLWQNQNSP